MTAREWAEAALEALAEGGLQAVAVEPVAARLGVSKGSFYWHFGNRRDLVEAALERWEAFTEDVIAKLARVEDPRERMRRLIEEAFGNRRDAAVSFRLISAADDPAVAEVARRVTERRLEVMAATLVELGRPEAEARDRVVAGYSSYLGVAALMRIGAIDSAPMDIVESALSELLR